MIHLQNKKCLIVSIVGHLIILSFFIISFNRVSVMPVFENTQQRDMISAVLLGDTPKSTILSQNNLPMTEANPLKNNEEKSSSFVKKNELDQAAKIIALNLEKEKALQLKKAQQLKDKVLANKMNKQLMNNNLLNDLQREKNKKMLKQKRQLQKEFEKTLALQSEETLRKQLLNETIKLRALEERRAQGVVNQYQALMMQAISEQWLIPAGTDPKRVTKLQIHLARDGSVLDIKIIKSSGDQILDSSVRAAVKKASPLPVPKDNKDFELFRQFELNARPEDIMT